MVGIHGFNMVQSLSIQILPEKVLRPANHKQNTEGTALPTYDMILTQKSSQHEKLY